MRRWSGDESCAHCLQSHHFVLERHCTVCDGPVCVFCVEALGARRALLCRACLEEEEARPQPPRRTRR